MPELKPMLVCLLHLKLSVITTVIANARFYDEQLAIEGWFANKNISNLASSCQYACKSI
jgi:hypothetical protein